MKLEGMLGVILKGILGRCLGEYLNGDPCGKTDGGSLGESTRNGIVNRIAPR